MRIEPLNSSDYRDVVRRALEEDVRDGDITTNATVTAAQRARGVFLVKAACVLAGLDVAFEAFRQLDPDIRTTSNKHDGDACRAGDIVAEADGSARALLVGERTALNFLQRLSGIATRARRYVDASGGRITILDTRKTTPGLRTLEKAAVAAGGGVNHRMGLYDAILIKENHIAMAGNLARAVHAARTAQPDMPIEVECRSVLESGYALGTGADRLLLDNMGPDELREAVALRDAERGPAGPRLEASGGVTLETVRDIAESGGDFISVGALTHSPPTLAFSMLIEPASRLLTKTRVKSRLG